MKLNGNICVITGGASGIGLAPLLEKQIPELAKAIGIYEEDVINKFIPGETVDKGFTRVEKFTTVEDVAHTALFLATFSGNALTGQSIVASHGWRMD